MGVHSDVLVKVLVEVDIRIQRLKNGAMVTADDQRLTLTVKKETLTQSCDRCCDAPKSPNQ